MTPSFAWLEQVTAPSASNPDGTWVRHVIPSAAAKTGPGIQFSFIDDLFGDGVTRAVATNHANRLDFPKGPRETLYMFDIPEAAKAAASWTATILSTVFQSRKSFPKPGIQSAPGVFGWGDMDADGDIDLAVSGDGDPALYWFEQAKNKTFLGHTLDTDAGEGSGMKIVDLDRNGKNEVVVVSYDNNSVYIYERN
jgi:hypothetical protein